MSEIVTPEAKTYPSRRPIVELLSLAVPTVAQMASYTTMQFIDIWMLSRLGETPATAAANSGMLAFALVSLGLGTLVLVNTLVSQSFGRGDFERCGQYLWQGIWLALIYGVALLPIRAWAAPVFGLFHHPASQAAMEIAYYRIVLLSAPLKLVSTAIAQFFMGTNRPNAVSASAIFGVSVNAAVAWCIVLGHGGFTSMGIAGAAWAQNIGVACECLTLATLALRSSDAARFNAMDMRPRPRQMATLLRLGVPSGAQWFSDVMAWSLFCNGVIGVLGPAAMAANAFMLRYMVVSFLPAYGLSVAVTALVGRYIGRGRPDLAEDRAHLGVAVTLVYVLACGTLFITARHPLIRLFSHDPDVIRIGAIYLIIAAVYEVSDALYILYSGALRGAGDTLTPTLVTAGLCWSIVVLGGYEVARRKPDWIAGPWIVACVYGAIVGLWMLGRFVRGKWRLIRIGEATG
jgi:multidrug resistance protein, MATE family